MTENVRVNTVMTRGLVERVDAYAAENHEDRSTAIRQLVAYALQQKSLKDAVEAYEGGRLTLREFARVLDVDVWKAQDILAVEGVAIAQGEFAETTSDRTRVVDMINGAEQ